ncbi:hypothetical protein EG329_013776 [Mollisiaceae sp. DMI_Dod_QoI]|nr:hypothetical protein EG329_013776 [Helotiales sp. DMI_Dod_QoI]
MTIVSDPKQTQQKQSRGAALGKDMATVDREEDSKASTNMCFYEQIVNPCGDWKWGNFKSHCSKEYRTGETCGMKMVFESFHVSENCKYCVKIETKQGRIRKEQDKIKRWKHEGNRRASIEQAQTSIAELEREIWELNAKRESQKHRRYD